MLIICYATKHSLKLREPNWEVSASKKCFDDAWFHPSIFSNHYSNFFKTSLNLMKYRTCISDVGKPIFSSFIGKFSNTVLYKKIFHALRLLSLECWCVLSVQLLEGWSFTSVKALHATALTPNTKDNNELMYLYFISLCRQCAI